MRPTSIRLSRIVYDLATAWVLQWAEFRPLWSPSQSSASDAQEHRFPTENPPLLPPPPASFCPPMARELTTHSADAETEHLSVTCSLPYVHALSTCTTPPRTRTLHVHYPSTCVTRSSARPLCVHGSSNVHDPSTCTTPPRALPVHLPDPFQVHGPFACMALPRARPLQVELLGLLSTTHHTSPIQHVFLILIEWDTLIAAFII